MNITNNTNSLSVTTPQNLEQTRSTALAVLNVTSSSRQLETQASTISVTAAAAYDPARWSALAQNLTQGQPITPIAQPQATTAGRRQHVNEESTASKQPLVQRRVRRNTATNQISAKDCSPGDLIVKKETNGTYKCLKLSDVFPEKGALNSTQQLLSKTDSAYQKIKDQFDNSTVESRRVNSEVLQRMVMTNNNALKADEKWRWQLYLNNSAE
ncbi:MAG: hypothetical protein ACRC9T_08140, partial [Vibrionaceae bacterium]